MKNRTYKIFTIADGIFIAICVLVSIYTFTYFSNHKNASTVVIYKGNNIVAKYPIDKNKKIELNGTDGPMTIQILNNKVSVTHSSCKGQICVHTPPIFKTGSQIICAPNRVLVTIESNKTPELDAISH